MSLDNKQKKRSQRLCSTCNKKTEHSFRKDSGGRLRWRCMECHRRCVIMRNKKPGMTNWKNMKKRCYNKNHENYSRYGGAGIKVCQRWINSYDNFIEDMGVPPGPTYTIDRYPNKNGDYSPNNCRWASKKEQSRNKSNNRVIEAFGKKKLLCEWSEDPLCVVVLSTLDTRIRRGWEPERAITQLPRGKMPKRQ